MYGYIYKFTFLPTGDFYVGKHKYENETTLDESYWGSGKKWNKLITKYQKSEWPTIIKREILEWCNTEDELNEREIYWISELNAIAVGMNISIGGKNPILYGEDNGFYGHTHSEETKQIISRKSSAWQSANKGYSYSKLREWQLTHPEEYSKAQSRHLYGEKNGMYGKGYLLKGRKFSEEHKLHLKENHADTSGENNPFYGKHHTEGTKDILSLKCGHHVYVFDFDTNEFICDFTSIRRATNELNLHDRRKIDKIIDKDKYLFCDLLNRKVIFKSSKEDSFND